MTLEIIPTGAAAGAEICGINLSEPLGDNSIKVLDHALGKYGVIFFRDQMLTPQQQLNITLSFGDLELNTFGESHGLKETTGIVVISNVEKNIIFFRNSTDLRYNIILYLGLSPRG